MAHQQMAGAGHEGQRDGVDDVGAHQPGRDHAVGVERQQHHRAQRTGANRGERDQKAQYRARQHGERRLRALETLGLLRAQLLAQRMGLALEDHGHRGEQQHPAQRVHQQAGLELRQLGLLQPGQGGQAAGQAAQAQPPKHLPIDAAHAVVHRAAHHLGDRGKPQVGADGRSRADAEQQHQDRRHQRAAADAGDADHHPHAKAGQCVEPVHGFSPAGRAGPACAAARPLGRRRLRRCPRRC